MLITVFSPFRLRIAFLPMLLHLHQSQLDFLINFFGGKSSSANQSLDHHQNSSGAKLPAMKSNNFAGHTIADEALLPYFQASKQVSCCLPSDMLIITSIFFIFCLATIGVLQVILCVGYFPL